MPPHIGRMTMTGKLTLGLYNTYDPKQWHDIMRITLCRAAPVALAFDADVVAFGFPFEQARHRGAKRTQPLSTPAEVATFCADATTIGEGGEYLVDLAKAGRLRMMPLPKGAEFQPKLGRAVITTPSPDADKTTTALDVAKELAAGRDQLLVFGLGPRGLPADVMQSAAVHLELTGKNISMETATALGALPAMIAAHLQHM